MLTHMRFILIANAMGNLGMVIISQYLLAECLGNPACGWRYLLPGLALSLAGQFLVALLLQGHPLARYLLVGALLGALFTPGLPVIMDHGLIQTGKAMLAMTPWAFLVLGLIYFKRRPEIVIGTVLLFQIIPVARLLTRVSSRFSTIPQSRRLLWFTSKLGTRQALVTLIQTHKLGELKASDWRKAEILASESGFEEMARLLSTYPR